MNHGELIEALVAKIDPGEPIRFTERVATKTIKALTQIITWEMQNNNSVTIPNLGSFRGLPQTARTGRNPRTGDEVHIPATTRVTFRAGKALREAMLNGHG